MRRTVSAEMAAATPSATNWRASSRQSHSANERPAWSGSAQARCTNSAATAGGENRRPAGAGQIGEAVQAPGEEPLAPVAHDPALDADAAGHLADRQPVGQEQDDPAALDQAVGDGRRALPAFEVGAFGVAEDEIAGEAGAGTGHGGTSGVSDDTAP